MNRRLLAFVAALSLSAVACAGASTPGATQSTTRSPALSASAVPTSSSTATPTVGPSPTEQPLIATAIAVGTGHACATTNLGGVKCWGAGRLGNGSNDASSVPVDVLGLSSGVTAIAADDVHTCALTNGGGVKCWGGNAGGQLGDGTTEIERFAPVDVVGLASGVTAIAAAEDETCALTNLGGVKCWGFNHFGQLGNGKADVLRHSSPVDTIGLPRQVTAIAGGYFYVCALTSGVAVRCWGINGAGQLGTGSADTLPHPTPVDATGIPAGVPSIAAGVGHVCVLTNAGGVRCLGYNKTGQLGNGSKTDSLVLVDVAGLTSGVAAIAAGFHHTCALTTAGGVRCWGYNAYGQLGNGSTVDSSIPVDVTGLTSGVAAIAANYTVTCALTTAGGVACWGGNGAGQLGDGTTTDSSIPVNVVFAAATGPQAIVQAFYDWYLGQKNTGGPIDLHTRSEVTPEFITAFETGGWPYDPILCAQDWPEWAKAGPAVTSGSSAIVHVVESFSPTAEGIPVTLTLGAAGWQISAVQCLP